MGFNFDYSTTKKHTSTDKNGDPYVKIYNNSKRKDVDYVNSYIFISEAAVKLLQEKLKTDKVQVGIDTVTQKIVIVPDREGRKMSKLPSGSAQVSIAKLIVENKIPTQTCIARPHSTFALGGIIFDYVL